MAKIGTAHVEIKPVLNEEALNELCRRIEWTVCNAVTIAMQTEKVKDAARKGLLRALYGDGGTENDANQPGMTNPNT